MQQRKTAFLLPSARVVTQDLQVYSSYNGGQPHTRTQTPRTRAFAYVNEGQREGEGKGGEGGGRRRGRGAKGSFVRDDLAESCV